MEKLFDTHTNFYMVNRCIFNVSLNVTSLCLFHYSLLICSHLRYITAFIFSKTKQELFFVMKSTSVELFKCNTYIMTESTIKILSFRVDKSKRTEETKIRLPLNPKQQTYQPFRGNNTKITKSGRIWNIF